MRRRLRYLRACVRILTKRDFWRAEARGFLLDLNTQASLELLTLRTRTKR